MNESTDTQRTSPAADPGPLDPVATAAGGGEARWWGDALAVIKVTAAETGGRMTIIEITEPPGASAPLHVHRREDEGFWILEGDATFEVGGQVVHAGPGDYLFGPRDIPHCYTVGENGCRMLFIFTPGGFEDLLREISEPAGSHTLPPADAPEPELERMAAAVSRHGAEILDG